MLHVQNNSFSRNKIEAGEKPPPCLYFKTKGENCIFVEYLVVIFAFSDLDGNANF